MSDTVNAILWSEYGWPTHTAPAPKSVQKALDSGLSEDAVASRLEAWLVSQADSGVNVPYGCDTYEKRKNYYRYEYFAIKCKFWEFNTAIALGQTVDAPVAHAPEAKTVDEWYSNIASNVNRLGFPLYNLSDPDSLKEKALREAFASVVPVFWSSAADPDSFRLGILNRDFEVVPGGFISVSDTLRYKLSNCRGLKAQQYLDNLRALDRHQPELPWPPEPANEKVPA